MPFLRHRLEWTGPNIGRGVTTFCCGDAEVFTDTEANASALAIGNFVNGIETYLPDDVSLRVVGPVEMVNEQTGALMFDIPLSPTPPTIVGDNTGGYAAGVGASIQLNTGDVRNGRRVKGRIFVVPLSGASFAPDGTLVDTVRNDLTTAAGNLLSGLNLAGTDWQVWRRPSTVGASDGELIDVSSVTVADKAAWLRTRRD
jgi:hypothetical protein